MVVAGKKQYFPGKKTTKMIFFEASMMCLLWSSPNTPFLRSTGRSKVVPNKTPVQKNHCSVSFLSCASLISLQYHNTLTPRATIWTTEQHHVISSGEGLLRSPWRSQQSPGMHSWSQFRIWDPPQTLGHFYRVHFQCPSNLPWQETGISTETATMLSTCHVYHSVSLSSTNHWK